MFNGYSMIPDGRLEVKGAGPILLFHCYSTAPLAGVALADLYGYLNSLLQPYGISKYIVCTDDKQDRAPLTECCARIPNCEVVFMSETFYAFNVCDHLLWYLNRILVPGTIILLTNIEEGYYYAAIKTIQGLGWHVILANQPPPLPAAPAQLPPVVQPIRSASSQSTANQPSCCRTSLSDSTQSGASTAHDTSEFETASESEPVLPHLLPVPEVMHDFLTKGVVHMTPLDLYGSRQLMDNFKRTICTLNDWPFFPPDYPMPSYNSRTESHLMKLMDSLNPVEDKTQNDMTDRSNSSSFEWGNEEQGVSTCSSMSYVDCFFDLEEVSRSQVVPLMSIEMPIPESLKKNDKGNGRKHSKPAIKATPKGKKKICPLNRSHSTPPTFPVSIRKPR